MCYTSLPLEVAKVVHSLSRHKISFFSSLRRLQARHAWHPSSSKGHPNAGEPWAALEYGPRNTVLPCQSRKPTEAGGGSVLSAQHAVALVCVERGQRRGARSNSLPGVRMRPDNLHKSPLADHVRRLTAQRSRSRASHNVWAPRRPLQRLLRCRNGAATLLFGCFYTHWQTTLARQRSWVAFGWGRPG